MNTILEGRAMEIHMARVYLHQARCMRQHHAFHATLLAFAGNRRRAAASKVDSLAPEQFSLFGDVA